MHTAAKNTRASETHEGQREVQKREREGRAAATESIARVYSTMTGAF